MGHLYVVALGVLRKITEAGAELDSIVLLRDPPDYSDGWTDAFLPTPEELTTILEVAVRSLPGDLMYRDPSQPIPAFTAPAEAPYLSMVYPVIFENGSGEPLRAARQVFDGTEGRTAEASLTSLGHLLKLTCGDSPNGISSVVGRLVTSVINHQIAPVIAHGGCEIAARADCF